MERTRSGRRALVALAAASLALAAGCAGADGTETEAGTGAETEGGPVTTAELVAEPANHVGEEVVLDAVVAEQLTPNAFTITAAGEPDPEGGGVVVIYPDAPVAAGDTVTVEGTVEDALDEEELEERFGSEWTDVMQEEHGGRPWVQASNVETAAS